MVDSAADCELAQIELPQEDGPGGIETLDNRRIVVRRVVGQDSRSRARQYPLSVDDVLDRYRNAVHLAPVVAARNLRLGARGLGKG